MKKALLSLFALILVLTSIVGLASCSKVEFKVDFVVDGEVYASVNTNGKETVKIPADPTKEGYIFDGWYWDKDSWKKPFTANSLLDAPISSDMSVYAKWKEEIHIHTPVIDEAVEPTDTKNGLTEGSHCSKCGVVIIAQENIPALIQGSAIKSATLKVEDDKISGVFSNTTEIFSFIDDISIAKGATYVLARDIYCENTIHSKTVQLEEGDNVFYILVTNAESMKLYTVTLRRRPIYIVSFDSQGGTFVENQLIEEGSFVETPTISRTGYTLSDWDYDFSKPIMKNETITANWSANTDTSYRVEYYLQNIDNTYPEIPEQTLTLLGITDTTVIAEQKEFEHFTFNNKKSITSGNVEGDGSLVLKVYYSRNSYTINTSKNNDKGGSITSSSTYKFDDRITITATTNPGYTFDGWFYEETLVCKNATYAFEVSQDSTYIAKWTANTNTQYKVEYYLQNYENDCYPLIPELTLNLTGTTDTIVIAEEKVFDNYTLDTLASTLKGNVYGDNTLVLKLYYAMDTYTLASSNTSYGTITNSNSYKYNPNATIESSIETGLGCEFLGWYCGETLLSTESTFGFTPTMNVEARFVPTEEMKDFIFYSTKTDCVITGIKDISRIEIVIPNCVTIIGEDSFKNCENLLSVTISNNVKEIQARAFSGCGKLVEVINKSALVLSAGSHDHGYIAYNALRIHSGKSQIKKVGEFYTIEAPCRAFPSYSYSTFIVSYVGNESELVIPKISGQYEIYKYAFAGNNTITKVTLPANIDGIHSSAFYNCTSLTDVILLSTYPPVIFSNAFNGCDNLRNVYFGGTKENWDKVSDRIYKSNEHFLSSAFYYYSENKPSSSSNQYWYFDEDGKVTVW